MKLSKGKLAGIVTVVTVLSAHAQPFHSFYKAGSYLTVHAAAGLSLREKPDVSAKVVSVIKLGDQVQVLVDSSRKVAYTSGGVPGNWVKVNYFGKVGYQFDGFLSRFPVAHADGRSEPGSALAAYFKNLYAVKKEVTSQPAGEQGEYRIWHVIDFDNGIHFEEKSWTQYDISISCPEKWFSFHEAFLLGREVWPYLVGSEGCPYDEGGILCEGAAPQYLRIQKEAGNVTIRWYVSD